MRLAFLLIVICSLTGIAQKNGQISSLDVYYGYRIQSQNFHNQLNILNDFNFNRPLQTVGVGLSGNFVLSRNGNFKGHFIYSQIVPQTISIQDTLTSRITGFVFSFAYGGAILTPSEKFGLTYYIGLNAGRIKINGAESLKQKNPFFSPKIGIQPKIRMGRLALIMTIEYEYDISKRNWKSTNSSNTEKYDLKMLRQTAFTGQVGIGYISE
jgi:hypothetical protein